MKYIAITGANSGIGYETAKAFERRGYSLIFTARHEDRLDALTGKISVKKICDVKKTLIF